jgi:hypothetical protein
MPTWRKIPRRSSATAGFAAAIFSYAMRRATTSTRGVRTS